MDGPQLHMALLDRMDELREAGMNDEDIVEVLRDEHGDHPDFSSKLNLALGYATPPAAVIPSDAPDWYQVESHHTFWPAYLEFLQDSNRGAFPDEAIASIHASTNKIMNRIADPNQPASPAYGMVVGHVQSGKTANFTGLLAKAADSGYNLFIVLSGGNFNDLRMQTQLRLAQQLTGQSAHPEGKIISTKTFAKQWHEATKPDRQGDRGSGEIGANDWNPDWSDRSQPCLIVTKKNTDSLEKLRTWANQLEQKENVRLLMIDDEADHASINIAEDKKGSAINSSLREVLHVFENYSFIGYTATPFANVFIHPNSDGVRSEFTGELLPTLYPNDFILALPEPRGYLGLQTMFGEDDWSHWTCEVEEEDAAWARKQVDHRLPSQELGQGLNNAVMDFLLTWALRSIRSDSMEFHHTMMVHTKETKVSMKPWITRVTNRLRSMQDAISSGRAIAMAHGKKLLDDLGARYQSEFVSKWDQERGDPPSEKEVFNRLKTLFRKRTKDRARWPDVANISSEKEDQEADEKGGEDLDYHLHPKGRVVIAVGGNRLSRGFTLEGLCVAYFIRHPSQLKSDTLLQQGRWFGHRHAYKDLVRLHTTPSLRANFHGLLKVETYLRDRLELMEERGESPRDFAIPVLKALDMIPTALNKMPKKKTLRTIDFSGDFMPSTMRAPLTKINHLEHNLKKTAKLLNTLPAKPERKLGRRLWRRCLEADQVMSYLKSLKFPKDPYKIKQMEDYLARRRASGLGEIESWSVALIGLDSGNKAKPFEEYGCKMDLVMQKRSKDVGSPDTLGTAHGPNDFALDLPGEEAEYRPNGTWSVRLLAGARAPDNPLLTLYVFDPNAEPPKGRDPLFPKGNGLPVVVPAMIFPNADIPEDERRQQSEEFWSNEALPDLEVE